MPQECLHILARNHLHAMAEITTVLAHRHARVISLRFTCSDPARLHAEILIDVVDLGESDLLRRQLNRVIDVIDVARRSPHTEFSLP